MICEDFDCTRPATHSLHLRFWAKGCARDTHQPAVTDAVTFICTAHGPSALKEEWYGPANRESMRMALRAAGLVEPDFDTAEVFLKEIEDGKDIMSAG